MLGSWLPTFPGLPWKYGERLSGFKAAQEGFAAWLFVRCESLKERKVSKYNVMVNFIGTLCRRNAAWFTIKKLHAPSTLHKKT